MLKNNTVLVTRPSMPDIDEYIDEIEPLWESHWITNMGAKHREFENNLKDYLNIDNIELLVNGHMALEMTIQSMELEGEVITTPFTFVSTTHAIVRNGLKPVFCDIRSDDYTIDVSKIENLITDKTCAIVPVHVYGNICDVEGINNIAKKYKLKVVYDAAHAFGESLCGKGIGEFGDASIFSFHATKVFNSIEGGAVSFRDEAIGKKLYELKNFGIHDEETISAIGANAKLNEFSAAMGICNLRHIDVEIEKRKRIYDLYVEKLHEFKGIYVNSIPNKVESNYSYFPIVVDEEVYGVTRDYLADSLEDYGIGTRKYFYPLTNSLDCYPWKYNTADTPIAKKISERILCLPIYADLPMNEVNQICETIGRIGRV